MNGYDLTNYYAYGHGSAPTAPVGDETANIVGLELEITAVEDPDVLDNLVDLGLIGVKDAPQDYVQLEYEAQHDVDFEVIFNADTAENVLGRLGELVANGLRLGARCRHNTSGHVHVNRHYLENTLGIGELDYLHATEAVAPLIYAVSGRDRQSWNEWTREAVDLDLDVLERFQYIDDTRPRSGRYALCNTTNTKDLEVRGFSNYYEFDVDAVAFYLAVASELIPAVAVAMKGRKYAEDYAVVFETVADFLSGHEYAVQRWNLEKWTKNGAFEREARRKATAAAINKYNEALRYVDVARGHVADRPARALEIIAQLLQRDDLDVQVIKLDALDVLLDDLEDQIMKRFKNAVWRA